MNAIKEENDTLLKKNLEDFHTSIGELEERADKIELILKGFMSDIAKLKDSHSYESMNDLILAALDQRQCARSIVFRGLVFLGYVNELVQRWDMNYFSGERLADNPKEMYDFYASVVFPEEVEASDLPAITSQRPVGVRQAFMKNLLEDSRWVDNVIYELRGKSWQDNTIAQDLPEGAAAAQSAARAIREIRKRRQEVDHRAGLNAARSGKIPVYLKPQVFAQLTFNFVQENLAKFVDKVLAEYETAILPTLGFSVATVKTWHEFLLNVQELINQAESLNQDVSAKEKTKFRLEHQRWIDWNIEAKNKTVNERLSEIPDLEAAAKLWREETIRQNKLRMIEYILVGEVESEVDEENEEYPDTIRSLLSLVIGPMDKDERAKHDTFYKVGSRSLTVQELIAEGGKLGISSSGQPIRGHGGGGHAHGVSLISDAIGHGFGNRNVHFAELTGAGRRGAVGGQGASGGQGAGSSQGHDGVRKKMSTRFMERYIREGNLVLKDWSLNDFEPYVAKGDDICWHENHERARLAKKKLEISLKDIILSSTEVAEEVSLRFPQILGDALDLAIKKRHPRVVRTLALAFAPGQPVFVPMMNKVFKAAVDQPRYRVFVSQDFDDDGQEMAEYFVELFEPWVSGFGSGLEPETENVMWQQFTKFSLKFSNFWVRHLKFCKQILENYFQSKTAHIAIYQYQKQKEKEQKEKKEPAAANPQGADTPASDHPDSPTLPGTPQAADETHEQPYRMFGATVHNTYHAVSNSVSSAKQAASETLSMATNGFRDLIDRAMPHQTPRRSGEVEITPSKVVPVGNVGNRVRELGQIIDRLIKKAERTNERATFLHNLLFEPIPALRWRSIDQGAAIDLQNKKRVSLDARYDHITGSIEFLNYFLQSGDLEDIPYLDRKFTRIKICAKPKTKSLRDYANHVVTRVSAMRVVKDPKTGNDAQDIRRTYDYPSNQQIEEACPKKNVFDLPGQAGQRVVGCMLTLSIAPESSIQIFSKPGYLAKGDQVLIKTDQIDYQADQNGEFKGLRHYHHKVGTFVADGHIGSERVVIVEFTNQDYTRNAMREETMRKVFPAHTVMQAPNTYFHAFCHANMWAVQSPRYQLNGMEQNYQSVRSFIEDLLHFDEIESALQIEDMYGHNALEILIRESQDKITPSLLRLIGRVQERHPLEDPTIFNRMLRTSVGGGKHGLLNFPSLPVFQEMLNLKPVIDTINLRGTHNTLFNHEVEVGRLERRFGANKPEILQPKGIRGWLGMDTPEKEQLTFGNLHINMRDRDMRDGDLIPEKWLTIVDTQFPQVPVLWCACDNNLVAHLKVLEDQMGNTEEFRAMRSQRIRAREAEKVPFEIN